MTTPKVVLDASAVLALLHGERGHEMVRSALPYSMLNVVNAAECVGVLAREGVRVLGALNAIGDLGVELVECDWAIASNAAQMRQPGARLGLSLGDCICLATARVRGAKALTADRAWKQLDIGVSIDFLR